MYMGLLEGVFRGLSVAGIDDIRCLSWIIRSGYKLVKG